MGKPAVDTVHLHEPGGDGLKNLVRKYVALQFVELAAESWRPANDELHATLQVHSPPQNRELFVSRLVSPIDTPANEMSAKHTGPGIRIPGPEAG